MVGRWTCNPEVTGSNPPPCHWMDLSSAAPNSISPRCVNSQLVSLPPVGILKSECPLTLSQSWHMMKNQNFSYSSQRYPRVTIEKWCEFFLEIFFLTRQKNQKSVTVPRLVKNTQISVTDTLSKTSLCLIRIKITRQFEPRNLFLRSLQVF